MIGNLSPQGGPKLVKPKTASSSAAAPPPPGTTGGRPMNRGEMARAARDAATQTGRATRNRHSQMPGSNQSITSMSDMSRGPRYVRTEVCPSPLFGPDEVPPQLRLACNGLTTNQDALEWAFRAWAILGMIVAAPGSSPTTKANAPGRLQDVEALGKELKASAGLTPDQSLRLCSAAMFLGQIPPAEYAAMGEQAVFQVAQFVGFLGQMAAKGKAASQPKMSGAKKAAIVLAVGAVGGGAIYWLWKHQRKTRRLSSGAEDGIEEIGADDAEG